MISWVGQTRGGRQMHAHCSRKCHEKRPLRRLWCGWEYNIKIGVRERCFSLRWRQTHCGLQDHDNGSFSSMTTGTLSTYQWLSSMELVTRTQKSGHGRKPSRTGEILVLHGRVWTGQFSGLLRSPWWRRQYETAKRWSTSTRLQGAVSHKTVILIFSWRWGGVGLVPKRGYLLTLAYYIFTSWYEFGERRWNDIDRGNRRTRRKTCPSATLSTTNSTWIDPGLRGERPATNDLSHGTALSPSFTK
jgi:hypothetical protein